MSDEQTLYVGAGAWQGDAGKIQVFTLRDGGELELAQELSAGGVAAYLVRSRDGRTMYVADETKARLASYRVIDACGRLELQSQIDVSGHPVYLTLDASGRFLVTCYFQEGRTELFSLEPDGSLGASAGGHVSGRESHCTVFDASGRYLFVPTRGDGWISQYRFDPTAGSLVPLEPPHVSEAPGAGPRHLVFHPDGRHAYLVNELSMTLSVYEFDAARGTIAPTQRGVPLAPAGRDGRAAADVRVHPGGRFLYASNRHGDRSTLAIFAIEAGGARVSLVGHEPSRGRTPRNFALDAAGKTLVVGNRESDNVSIFRVEDQGAALRHVAVHPVASGPFFVGIYPRS